MGAITTADGLFSAIAGRSQFFSWWRANTFSGAAGQHFSLWLGTGSPGPGVAPGAAAIPTSATAGAIAVFTDPAGGEFAHLVSVDANFGTAVATVEVWDRLAHCGGLSGTSVALQAVNTPALTRGDTTGIGVEGYLECYTATGATQVTATVTYTNTAGTGSRTATVTVPSNWPAGRLLHISPLQAGDQGIRSVQSVQLSASTLTAGDFGVTLARLVTPICTKVATIPELVALLDLGLPRVEAGACLWLTAYSSTGTIGIANGGLQLITTGATAAPESTTIAALNTIISTRLQHFDISRLFGASTTAQGFLWSGWVQAGDPPTGVTPGAAAVVTSATAGALAAFQNPTSGDFAHLYGYGFTCFINNQGLWLYDRLVQHGGASGTSVALVAVNTPALTRGDTTGIGVEGFIECYSVLGGTPQTLTVSYTNTAGVAGRLTTVAIPASMRAGRLLPIPLLTGDIGIRSIETIQLGGSTGTAGSYGVTLARRIVCIPPRVETETEPRRGLEIGYPRIEPDACLWLCAMTPASSGSADVVGTLSISTTG